MYKIRWRKEMSVMSKGFINDVPKTVYGISSYSTIDRALAQIEIWKRYFPQNKYYIICSGAI